MSPSIARFNDTVADILLGFGVPVAGAAHAPTLGSTARPVASQALSDAVGGTPSSAARRARSTSPSQTPYVSHPPLTTADLRHSRFKLSGNGHSHAAPASKLTSTSLGDGQRWHRRRHRDRSSRYRSSSAAPASSTLVSPDAILSSVVFHADVQLVSLSQTHTTRAHDGDQSLSPSSASSTDSSLVREPLSPREVKYRNRAAQRSVAVREAHTRNTTISSENEALRMRVESLQMELQRLHIDTAELREKNSSERRRWDMLKSEHEVRHQLVLLLLLLLLCCRRQRVFWRLSLTQRDWSRRCELARRWQTKKHPTRVKRRSGWSWSSGL